MKVTLMEHTPEPEKLIAAAAKLCYSSAADINTLMNGLTFSKIESFVAKLETLHHESPFEHASFTFGIEGVSRALTHQLVRHRLASFSQRSQRYCVEGCFEYVTPSSIQRSGEMFAKYKVLMDEINMFYEEAVAAGVPKGDARMALPNACSTRLLCTMNVRELWNFFNHRCCSRAQWEIRDMADQMLELCKSAAPLLFEHAGASCVKGYCPEGSMCCGRAPTMDELIKGYKKEVV